MYMLKFDLQLFAEEIEIPGIDPEIAKQVAAEYNEGDDNKEPNADDAEGGNAEADSDNKQVADGSGKEADGADNQQQESEEGADDFEDLPEGSKIPYPRFKELNQRRKSAEARVKELEAKLKVYEEGSKTTAPPAPAANLPFKQQTQSSQQQKPAPQNGGEGEFTAQQIERIAQLAIERAKNKLNLTDDDVENLDYSDKPELKVAYNNLVSEEMRNIRKEVQRYKADRAALEKQISDTTQEFDALGNKLGAYEDAKERWDFIGVKHFESLPQRQQQVLNDAFVRLQNKRGTYADMYLINEYFERANKLYEQQKAGAAAANNAAERNNNKMNSVRNLPKAPGVNGGASSDNVLTPERIEHILNTPGLWNKLSEAEKQMVLSGNLR